MEKHYRVFAVIFAIVGFICMLGGLVFLFINEMYHVTIWWYFVIGMILVILGGVCGYTAAVFSNLAGGNKDSTSGNVGTGAAAGMLAGLQFSGLKNPLFPIFKPQLGLWYFRS